MTAIGILVTIPIASYLHFRDQANDATARANARVIVRSIESHFADNSTYVGMTLDGLKASYDHAIDPARYTLTSLGATGFCVSSSSGGRSWKKAGPAPSTRAASAPDAMTPTSSEGWTPEAGEETVVTIEAACAFTVEALSRALELHDYRRGLYAETGEHCARVSAIAMRLAERVAPDLTTDPQLAFGFRLHDIGMIGVSTTILLKAGPLTLDELDELREHPLLGERIVAPAAYLGGIARQVIAAHHEKWDGSGYPHGLEGKDIPLAARIFALADAFDSMTTDQPYRKALPRAVVLREIEAGSGSHFDPDLVPAFLELVRAGPAEL